MGALLFKAPSRNQWIFFGEAPSCCTSNGDPAVARDAAVPFRELRRRQRRAWPNSAARGSGDTPHQASPIHVELVRGSWNLIFLLKGPPGSFPVNKIQPRTLCRNLQFLLFTADRGGRKATNPPSLSPWARLPPPKEESGQPRYRLGRIWAARDTPNEQKTLGAVHQGSLCMVGSWIRFFPGTHADLNPCGFSKTPRSFRGRGVYSEKKMPSVSASASSGVLDDAALLGT